MEEARFYKHAVPTGLKSIFWHTRFASKVRCGWETAPTGLGKIGITDLNN